METKTSRETALEWWQTKSEGYKTFMAWEFFQRKPHTLTGREIEIIWNAHPISV